VSDLILRIAVPSPLDRTFDYLPPPGCDLATLQPGLRVRVPFGRRHVVGFLLELGTDTTLNPTALRPVQAVLDTEAVLPADVLALLRWAQRYYHHPPGDVFATALPTLLRQGESTELPAPAPLWQITATGRAALATGPSRAPAQKLLLDYLARCPDGADADTLRAVVRDSTATLRALRAKNWAEPLAHPASALAETTCAPRPPPALNAAQAAAVTQRRGGTGPLPGLSAGRRHRQRQNRSLPAPDRSRAGARPASAGADPGNRPDPTVAGPLPGTAAGTAGGAAFRPERSGTIECLAVGARRHRPGGGRHPLSGVRATARPGILIVDEEHDPSFKQQDGFRYHARDLAVIRGQQLGIPVVLGSATPALESRHNAQRGRYRLLNCRNGSAAARSRRLKFWTCAASR
jgi:primosomal protein N' (replication factor Y)